MVTYLIIHLLEWLSEVHCALFLFKKKSMLKGVLGKWGSEIHPYD